MEHLEMEFIIKRQMMLRCSDNRIGIGPKLLMIVKVLQEMFFSFVLVQLRRCRRNNKVVTFSTTKEKYISLTLASFQALWII